MTEPHTEKSPAATEEQPELFPNLPPIVAATEAPPAKTGSFDPMAPYATPSGKDLFDWDQGWSNYGNGSG